MKEDTKSQGEDRHVTGVMHPQAKEHQKVGRGKEGSSPRVIREITAQADLDFRRLASRIVRQ